MRSEVEVEVAVVRLVSSSGFIGSWQNDGTLYVKRYIIG